MNVIQQGETFTFDFQISGDDLDGLSANMTVMQYPGDTPAITKALTLNDGKFTGTLTSAETAALDVGQWFIHNQTTDADEDVREMIKLYIAKAWV